MRFLGLIAVLLFGRPRQSDHDHDTSALDFERR